ncbi:MAG: ABC transporter permease [Candidatus Fermentibacter sp.]|nr:ABC transporter permease [Candidatus Fermentibacter sp.]
MGSLSWHLAWRYMRRHPERRTVALASVVSISGVALGVAALIIVMGVMEGLEGFISGSVTTAEAPLEIVPGSGGALFIPDSVLAVIGEVPGIASVSPYIEGEAIVRLPSRDLETGCRIRGIDPVTGISSSGLDSNLVYGEPRLLAADGFPCTVTGLYLAEDLYHPLGDTLIFFPPESFFTSRGFAIGRAVLAGAVETGLPVNDRALAYVPMELAARMFLPRGGCSGIAVGLEDGVSPEEAAELLGPVVPDSVRLRTWKEKNPSLAASMQLEKMGSFAAILLITLVATFNITGTIARSVVERRRDISILKAMGASSRLILSVFIWEGALVGLIGVSAGLALGLTGCWLVGGAGILTLPDVYSFHEHIPVSVVPASVAATCAASLLLSLASAAVPAFRAASLDPLRGLRG